MILTVDLTKEKFDDYDTISFYDSKTIFFDAATELPKTVSFKVWGAGVLPGFNWSEHLDLSSQSDLKSIIDKSPVNEVAIQGFGILTFEQVVAGKISIWPYDKSGDFLKYNTGEKVEYKREWNLNRIDDQCYEYWLDTFIYFPNGACDLKLYAKGKVSFVFDTKDCVNYLNYITNPNKRETFWGYLKDKQLTTNSNRYEELDSKGNAK